MIFVFCRTQESALLAPQQAPGFSLQNCSNLLAGEFAGGAVSFVGESGVAPPGAGGAAPPWGVLGFDWVVVCTGVVVVAVLVDVEVSVVVVSLALLSTVGV